MEDTQSVHIEGKTEHEKWDSIESYRETYEHPLWKSYLAEGVRGGHDGMDYLVLRSFVENAKAQAVPPIDVYDAAAWMAVTCPRNPSPWGARRSAFRISPAGNGSAARRAARDGTPCDRSRNKRKRTASRSFFYQNNPDQSTLYFCSATATRRKYSALML